MTSFQKTWIENESLRSVMREGVEEASRQLGATFWVTNDGKIRGDYSEEQYLDGILEEATGIALEYLHENEE